MADTTILAAENSLIEKLLYYTNYDSDGDEAYTITIGTKREGDPRRWVGVDAFPFVTVQILERAPGQQRGQQQDIIFTARVSVVHEYAATDEPTVDLRILTGKIVENILQTKTLLTSGQWLDLTWINDIPFPRTRFAESDIERFLRTLTPQEGSSAVGWTGSETDFLVTTTTQ